MPERTKGCGSVRKGAGACERVPERTQECRSVRKGAGDAREGGQMRAGLRAASAQADPADLSLNDPRPTAERQSAKDSPSDLSSSTAMSLRCMSANRASRCSGVQLRPLLPAAEMEQAPTSGLLTLPPDIRPTRSSPAARPHPDHPAKDGPRPQTRFPTYGRELSGGTVPIWPLRQAEEPADPVQGRAWGRPTSSR